MSLPSARPVAFNRRLRAEWLEEGLRLRAEGVDGVQWLDRMEELVRRETTGRDSIQKSMRYLRHIWLEGAGEDDLRIQALSIYQPSPRSEIARVISWGMAIATYPFLNDVAATLGRMLRVQPEVKLEQLLRKLTETHGEKESVRRSGRYSLSLICDLGFVERTSSAGCYRLASTTRLKDPKLSGWFLRAWFRASGKEGTMDREALAGAPSLVFFDGPALVSEALQEGTLVMERLSFSQDTVRLSA